MDTVLELKKICASYEDTRILKEIDLKVGQYRTVGIVGESGSGKSTMARVITGLLRTDCGEVQMDGRPLGKKRTKEECQKIQMVFQNPEGSLNPKHKIGRTLSDAMLFHGTATKKDVREQCQSWVEKMQLPEDTLDRYPRSFSGGQKQRIALARALCVRPKILIADEPTSALDVSVQLQMLELIRQMKEEMDLTILFISHDLGVIHYICDEVVVMKQGQILEVSSREEFFACPKTAYGRALLDAVPRV
jgi:peptide/nickel transport system ATP-binding protein